MRFVRHVLKAPYAAIFSEEYWLLFRGMLFVQKNAECIYIEKYARKHTVQQAATVLLPVFNVVFAGTNCPKSMLTVLTRHRGWTLTILWMLTLFLTPCNLHCLHYARFPQYPALPVQQEQLSTGGELSEGLCCNHIPIHRSKELLTGFFIESAGVNL